MKLYNKAGQELETIESLLPHQKAGLQYTASGYGRKIPTSYKIRDGKRWFRVYCCQYSNAGTCYYIKAGQWVIVN